LRVEVNEERARAVGALIGRAVKDVRPDPFDDPRYYPPPGAPRRQVMSYFLVMVAMDHRLSRGRRQYEAVIGESCTTGLTSFTGSGPRGSVTTQGSSRRRGLLRSPRRTLRSG